MVYVKTCSATCPLDKREFTRESKINLILSLKMHLKYSHFLADDEIDEIMRNIEIRCY